MALARPTARRCDEGRPVTRVAHSVRVGHDTDPTPGPGLAVMLLAAASGGRGPVRRGPRRLEPPPRGPMNLPLHHIGIVVTDIARSADEHRRRFGCEPLGELFHDPIQTALIQFLAVPGSSVLIELVAPDGPDSKLSRAASTGGGIHHLCYATDDIEATCSALRDDGMVVFQDPTPAVGFAGRRIAWLMGHEWYLTELVELDPPGRPPTGVP